MQALQLGLPVDCLAACRTDTSGDTLVAGLSNFTGQYWTGCIALLNATSEQISLTSTGELASGVASVAALPEMDPYTGRLLVASGGDDGAVSLWEGSTTSDGSPLRQAQMLTHHDDVVSGVAAGASNAELASCSWDGSIRLWSCTQLLTCTGQLVGHRGAVHAVAWEPSTASRLMSAGQDGMVRIWDPRSPSAAVTTLQVGAPTLCLSQQAWVEGVRENNVILAGDQLGRLSYFDLRAASSTQGRRRTALLGCEKVLEDSVRSVACLPDGPTGKAVGVGAGATLPLDIAVGGDDGKVVLFSSIDLIQGLRTEEVKVAFETKGRVPAYVRALAWGTSGRLYRGGRDTRVEAL